MGKKNSRAERKKERAARAALMEDPSVPLVHTALVVAETTQPDASKVPMPEPSPNPIRVLGRSFWDWGARWNWWAILVSGALGAMPRMGEYGLSILCILIAAFGAISKIAHWAGREGSSNNERQAWKALGIAVVSAGFAYMIAVTTLNAVRDNSWSNLPRILAVANSLRSGSHSSIIPTPSKQESREGKYTPALTQEQIETAVRHVLPPSVPMHPLQIEAIKDVDHFLAGKDESGLRHLFAFRLMMDVNIRMVTDQIRHFQQPVTNRPPFNIDLYRGDGELLLGASIAGGDIHRQGGGLLWSPDPEKVTVIVLPAQYISSRNMLRDKKTASGLPSTIYKSLDELDKTIYTNTYNLLKTLNDAMKNSKDYYLQYNNEASSYFHAIDGVYLKDFIPLEPKAVAVRKSIRSVLEIQ